MIVNSTPYALHARHDLRISIAKAALRGKLSITDELIGYTLAGLSIAEKYSPKISAPSPRKIAVPEVLTGILTDRST